MLKTKTLKFGDIEISVHEMSFISSTRMNDKIREAEAAKAKDEPYTELSNEDIWSECMSAEDWEKMNLINREDGEKVIEAIREVNSWGKYNKELSIEDPDFIQPPVPQNGK